MNEKSKPLGRKAYGSIGHLPGSRLGPGDHKCHDGQSIICTEKKRDRHDRIIVTEKLDGSNVAIANIGGEIVPLVRAGYTALSSPHEQHHIFAHWVYARADRYLAAIPDGHRINCEWLAMAHGTRYKLPHDPLVAFDVMAGEKRMPYDDALKVIASCGIEPASLLHDGDPISIEAVMKLIKISGHGAIDPVEGAVWRVERRGEFDFMAKFVHHDKQDGAYFAERNGGVAIWNWRPEAARWELRHEDAYRT